MDPIIKPVDLEGLVSFEKIMLNGGLGIPLPNHQQAMLKACVEVCKEKKKFVPISLKSIQNHLKSLPTGVGNFIPVDLTIDLPILYRKGWIKSSDPNVFELTQKAKEDLQKSINAK
ncbi:MAG: hypothetical protein WC606_00150 [Candidatus Absconditabacterales bacterium]|jgi:hypothetical protein